MLFYRRKRLGQWETVPVADIEEAVRLAAADIDQGEAWPKGVVDGENTPIVRQEALYEKAFAWLEEHYDEPPPTETVSIHD